MMLIGISRSFDKIPPGFVGGAFPGIVLFDLQGTEREGEKLITSNGLFVIIPGGLRRRIKD